MMAKEYTYTELVDAEHQRSHTGPEHPMHSPRKYRSKKKENADLDGVEIKRGSRVIVRCFKRWPRDVEGYLLCAVIDAEEMDTFWTDESVFIVEVLDASNKTLEKHVGRLRHISARSAGWWTGDRNIAEVGKANWANYRPRVT